VVAGVLLVKAGLPGVALAVNIWIVTTFWNSAADPMAEVVHERTTQRANA
jgi:hypothetical protein